MEQCVYFGTVHTYGAVRAIWISAWCKAVCAMWISVCRMVQLVYYGAVGAIWTASSSACFEQPCFLFGAVHAIWNSACNAEAVRVANVKVPSYAIVRYRRTPLF